MNSFEFVDDYLYDQETRMKILITWLLNQMMLQGALQPGGSHPV